MSDAYDELAGLLGLENPNGHDLIVAAKAEIERLATENERLRAALQAIDGINDNPACFRIDVDQIIRRALEGK